MSVYLTTESEISELSEAGDEFNDLINRNNAILNELETVKKESKDKEFELNNSISILTIENENLKQTIRSYEELIEFYKNTNKDSSNSSVARKSTSVGLIKSNVELINKITMLESKNFNAEQNEHNLRREIFTLNSTINDMKIEMDNLNSKLMKRDESDDEDVVIQKKINYKKGHSRRISENMSVIDENDVQALLQEIDDLKKENAEISERALNMLAEKELIILELRSEIEEIKQKNTKEYADLNKKIPTYKPVKTYSQKDLPMINCERNSDSELLLKYNILEEEYNNLKQEIHDKENLWKQERETSRHFTLGLENSHRIVVNNLENEISKYKSELFHMEFEKNILEKELVKDKSSIQSDIENYTSIIKSLEEQKEKSELGLRNQINFLQSELNQLDMNNNSLREQIFQLEKKISELKNEHIKKIDSIQSKWKYDNSIKNNEYNQLKTKLENSEKDKETLKKECENNRKIIEKTKLEYKDLLDQIKRVKELHEDEIKTWEDKLLSLEKNNESENIFLNNKIKELNSILEDKGLCDKFLYPTDNTDKKSRSGTKNVQFNLSTEDNPALLRSTIQNQEMEIQKLNSLLKLKENKNVNVFRLNGELETLKKEKSKIKSEMMEMKEMYEIQIKDLVQKINLSKRDSAQGMRKSTAKPGNFNSKQLLENLELEEKINQLTVENKFLTEQNDVLKKEAESIKQIKDNYIKKLKDDLEDSAQIASTAKVSLAQIVFEKDSEIVKYKRLCKKLKQRLANAHVANDVKTSSSNYHSNTETPKSKTTFFRNLFK